MTQTRNRNVRKVKMYLCDTCCKVYPDAVSAQAHATKEHFKNKPPVWSKKYRAQ